MTADPMPHRIGRYVVRSELRRGGQCTVYVAFDPHFKREVALKLFPIELLHDATFLERFDREAHTLASLEHYAIVPVYDYGKWYDQPYIVMRLMTGGNLADRITKGPMPLFEVIPILSRLASALDKAHTQGIIHRDVKPGNILFDQDGKSYLSDFGTMKFAESTSSVLTATGTTLGTPAYMSPEQARALVELDGRSDVYSLGVVLYEMLSGVRPYNADTPMGLAMMHVLEPVPRILDAKRDLEPTLEPIISKALAKDREYRFPSAPALAQAANAAFTGQVSEPTTAMKTEFVPPGFVYEPETIKTSSKRKISTWLIGVFGVVFFIAATILTLFAVGMLGSEKKNGHAIVDSISITQESQIEYVEVTRLVAEEIVSEVTRLVTQEPMISNPPTAEPALAIPVDDRGRIAFVSDRDGDDEIYMMDSDGVNVIQLTNNNYSDYDPAFSPDGKQIAFVSDRSGDEEIFFMNNDGSVTIQLTDNDCGEYDPVYSPDGSQIAYLSDCLSYTQVFMIDIDGSNIRRVTNEQYHHWNPAFSPDGRQIAFASDLDGDSEIFVMDADGSNVVQLTNNTYGDFAPSFSPDGGQIIFESWADGDGEIYVMDNDGSNVIQMTDNDSTEMEPRFSLDGSQIAFAFDQGEGSEILLMNADGSNIIQLTENNYRDYSPVWSLEQAARKFPQESTRLTPPLRSTYTPTFTRIPPTWTPTPSATPTNPPPPSGGSSGKPQPTNTPGPPPDS